jgi:putative nucleotidyltransferase with HDIG domain
VTGGKHAEDPINQNTSEWRGRPRLAWLLRALSVLIPLAVGVVAALLLAEALPEPEGAIQVIGWWAVLLGVSLVATLGTDRLTRRLLPLAALYKMTLIFPDRAPSRLRVARVQGSVPQLQRWLATVDIDGIDDRAKAAEIIISLASALSVHDPKTRGHAERVRAYTDLLAEELGIPAEDANKLRWAALLHDIGKLRVPSEILNTDVPLTDEQWRIVRSHPIEGMKVSAQLVEWLGPWANAIAHHHERWDGGGYPFGLAGNDIAYGARIVTVADAYDAITAHRSYKDPMSPEAARQELAANAGTQFDPKVVRALLSISIGRIRWVMGPAAWLSQIPFIGGFERLGRDVATVGLALMLLVGLGSAGLVGQVFERFGWNQSASVLGETIEAAGSAPATSTTETTAPTRTGTVPAEPEASATTSTTTPPSTATTSTTSTTTPVPTTTVPVIVVATGPDAVADQVSTPEDSSVTVVVAANDRPGTAPLPPAPMSIVAGPVSGSATIDAATGLVTYSPLPNFFGPDGFTYRLCDTAGLCDQATVSIVVTAVNDAPAALPDSATTDWATPVEVAILANDHDVDGDRLTATLLVGSWQGTVTITSSGSLLYQPALGVGGMVMIGYSACDGSGGCSRTMVTIEVTSAFDDEVTLDRNGVGFFDVLANDGVAPEDVLSLEIVADPAHGSAGVVGGPRIRYRPERGFVGEDRLEYRTCLVGGSCYTATVTISVR